MATNYNINYEDEKFTQVEADKNQALTEVEQTYGGMINDSDSYYQAQIDATKEWADKQSQLQQENTDFAIEKIEQQKQQTQKDYTKEQSGAYVDWQKQSNQYGVNAEQMAMQGMVGTGYSESSQVSMYNTYQNRVAVARESYQKAVMNFDNNIKEAILQNNSALAEISYQALQQQLELSLQGFQYKNNLLLDQMNKKQEIDNTYYNRYQDVLTQMNRENELTEQIRQYEQNYALQVKEFEEGIRQFNEEIARLKKKDEQEYALQIQELEEKKRQFEAEYKLAQDKFNEDKRQFDLQYQLTKSKSSGSGGAKLQDSPKIQDTPKVQNEQPGTINGHGTVTLRGQVSVNGKNYKLYTAQDGTSWYWEPSSKKYIKVANVGGKNGYLTVDQQLSNMVAANSLMRK